MVHLLNASESGTKSYHNNDIISTREHFNYQSAGQLIQGHNMTDYVYSSDLANNSNSKEYNQLSCPPKKEIAIYIHGVWTDERSANEQFNRTAMSLASNYYSIPLIGFSWDSNTPINKDGWETAKNIAERNGPKLVQFVIDFKNKCRDTDIRFIAHSLGAAVVKSALASLSSNQEWNDKG
jgi:esterase/lipase superfamily enzyme